jgi:hypothetical protein
MGAAKPIQTGSWAADRHSDVSGYVKQKRDFGRAW